MPLLPPVMTAIFPSCLLILSAPSRGGNSSHFCMLLNRGAACCSPTSLGPCADGVWRRANACGLEAAGDGENFAGHVFGVGRSEIDGSGGDVVGLADEAQRGLRLNKFAEITFHEACGVDAFGLDHPGVDGIDADLARAEFLGKRAGDDVDGALGGGVDGGVGRSQPADRGADIDDAAALIREELERFLGGEKQAEDVEIEMCVEDSSVTLSSGLKA